MIIGTVAALIAALLVALWLREKPLKNEGATQTIIVNGGTVELGLPDDARALMMLACQRREQEQKKCEEAILFDGEFPKQATVENFAIDALEVSVARFEKCVAAGNCGSDENCDVYTHEGKQFGAKPPKSLQSPKLAKVCVSQTNARAFCESQNGRLPTRAEFIRAARGDTKRIFPWGDHWDPAAVNWAERDALLTPVLSAIDGFGFTAPPGSFRAGCTDDGICDLSGNVAEWLEQDSTAAGGSWTDSPFNLRVTRTVTVGNPRTDVGFRCAYSTPE